MAKTPSQTPSEQTNIFTRFVRYVEESKAELHKITWPTLSDTRKATLAVLAFSVLMAILLGLVDLGLSSLVQFVLS